MFYFMYSVFVYMYIFPGDFDVFLDFRLKKTHLKNDTISGIFSLTLPPILVY